MTTLLDIALRAVEALGYLALVAIPASYGRWWS